MSDDVLVEETAAAEEPVEETASTSVPESDSAEPGSEEPAAEDEDEVEEPEVDEEVESDVASPVVGDDVHPGRLAAALVGPTHHDLNPAFAPQ